MKSVFLVGLPEYGFQWLLFIFILALPFILALVALINVVKSDFINDINKVVWILIILLLPLAGPLLYFIMAGSQKKEAVRVR